MKKIVLIVVLCGVVLGMSGCSLVDVQEQISAGIDWVMQKDQQFEQGFEVTPELVAELFDKSQGYLDFSDIGLTGIPDICALLSGTDSSFVQVLNLSENKIRIVDQDLSCLTNLRILNLSYNDIVQVVTLGSLPRLQELLLQKNSIKEAESLNTLQLPALERLNLAYNKIQKIISLEGLQNLTVLELQHNALESIVGVENLQKLEQLKLEFNKLTDLPFLSALPALQSLTTEGNDLQETIRAQAKILQDKFVHTNSGQNTGGNQE